MNIQDVYCLTHEIIALRNTKNLVQHQLQVFRSFQMPNHIISSNELLTVLSIIRDHECHDIHLSITEHIEHKQNQLHEIELDLKQLHIELLKDGEISTL